QPATLAELTVAVKLSGGEVSAVVETSDDGFQTVLSQSRVSVNGGAHAYPLKDLRGNAARVRFDLLRRQETDASPVVDGFRLVAKPRESATDVATSPNILENTTAPSLLWKSGDK
ncbi:MAG: hypothetical protein K8R46_12455, partial [Pirellulales bacterium]|nr:hypothetical protein [Pirellulales bacterium]